MQAESGTVKCLVTVEEEAESNEFGSGDLFLMIGPADSSGVAPVLPLFYAFTYGL